MKFAIYALQQFMSDYNAMPHERKKRTHYFVNNELPNILKIMIEEERKHEHDTPFD